MKMMDKICVVILNYNNFSDTIKTVKNLKRIKTSCEISIVVVDNNSTDGSSQLLKRNKEEMDFNFVQSEINGGYAFGNNKGIEYSLSNDFDYTLILNNDVLMTDYSIDNLVGFYKEDKFNGIIGPVICEYNSEIIQSAGAINDYITGRSKLLHSKEYYSDLGKDDGVDYISGSCLLLSNNILKKIPKIPELYFLFYEENEWCLRIKEKGFKVKCCHDVKVFHKHSATINKISGISKYFMLRNMVIFENRNASLIDKTLFHTYMVLRCIKKVLLKDNPKEFINCYRDAIYGKNKYSSLIK